MGRNAALAIRTVFFIVLIGLAIIGIGGLGIWATVSIAHWIGDVADQCDNRPGIDWSVPKGFVENEDGNCVRDTTAPPPTSTPVPPSPANTPVPPSPGSTPVPPSPANTPAPVQPTGIAANLSDPGQPQVALESGGRIWMPGGDPASGYTLNFSTPGSGLASAYTFKGVNATLMDSSGAVLARNTNTTRVVLKASSRYTVMGGSGNGGFALEPTQ